MRQKLLLFAFLLQFVPFAAYAYYEIDGIYYALNNGKAIVNAKDNNYNSYSGDVVIPETVTYYGTTYTVVTIGYDAFRDCPNLTSVSMPNTVTLIGERAFQNCTALTTVNISEGVSSIMEYTFYGCRSLTSIAIPNSVSYISNYAFYNCTSLTSVSLGNGLTSIGQWAFYSCSSLTSVTIPNSVTYIGQWAFQYCTNMTSLTIGNGVKTIANGAFGECTNLTSIILGNNLQTIDKYAFQGCKAITAIVLPESLTTIGESAFQGCSALSSVVIPESLTSIGSYAFSNCGLTSVTIPNNITSISDYTFYRCEKLKSVIIGDGVTDIGVKAFYYCEELKSVIIGSSVTSIGSQAFDCPSFGSLTDVYCYAENVPTAASNTFQIKNLISYRIIEATLHVPEASIESYQNASPWNLFETIVQAPNRTARIDGIYYNFSFFDKSAEVTFGDKNYSGEVVIPKTVVSEDSVYTVTSIGSGAFSNCYNLSSITIPESVNNISKKAFLNTNAKICVKDKSLILVRLWKAGYEENVYDTMSGEKIEPFRLVSGLTASSIRMNEFIDVNGVEKLSEKIYINGVETNDMTFFGLDPDTEVNARISVGFQHGGEVVTYEKTEDVRTQSLTLTTLQPRVISEGNVIVAAQSNLDDEEANVGFEWRRNDWTDDFDSKTGGAYLYEGMMEGYIRSINSNYLWKFRPYYTSNAGNTYYGEWKGLDPSDYSYFEPTVHTYATINVQGNSAEVKGYAMRGTDRVTSQGFMYWKASSSYSLRKKVPSIPSDAVTVEASGNVMTAVFENLDYETQYCYVAFVKTEENETFFGEVQTFKTNVDPDGIKDIEHSPLNIEEAWYSLDGKKLSKPQKGINILRYSDGTTRKVLVK